MKKLIFGVAAFALIGLASCSGKSENNVDSAADDSANNDTVVNVVEATEVTVDSINPDSANVNVQQVGEVSEQVVPNNSNNAN